tara:strand:- start:37 stop:246 length:210 start_codon:yes stop_codon:yes gene_type:complete
MEPEMDKTPTQIAMIALDSIRQHQAECSENYKIVHQELLALRQRWEKLAWLIIGTMMLGIVTFLFDSLK